MGTILIVLLVLFLHGGGAGDSFSRWVVKRKDANHSEGALSGTPESRSKLSYAQKIYV
jgi:hypothetical protein